MAEAKTRRRTSAGTAARAAARPRRAPAAESAAGPEGAGPAPDEAADAAAHVAPICSVAFCPVCTMVTALGEVRPDLTEHLLLAGREILLALRALIDARLEGEEKEKAGPTLERISID